MAPATKEELRGRIMAEQEETGFRALSRLAVSGSASADVKASRWRPTQEALKEALYLLSDGRAAQVNLAEIISAACCEILTEGGIFRAKCPKRLRFQRDSFRRMIECYELTPRVAQGARAAPFLVTMAKRAMPAVPRSSIPMYIQ